MQIPCDEYPIDALPWYVSGDPPPAVDPPLVTELHWWTNPAVWVWAGIIVGVLAVEIWARFGKKHQSPSQWLNKWAKQLRWLQIFGTALFSFLIWHFFWSPALRFLLRNR